MEVAVSILLYALDLYSVALILRILSSWIPGSYNMPLVRYLINITEPVLAPIGKVIPPIAGLDFSPMVLLLLISVVQELLRMTILS